MIEAYAIGVSAKLEDGMTPGLMRIVDYLTKANVLMLDFTANLKRMERSLLQTNLAATALGDNAGLVRASSLLDTMVASSAALTRNLAAARAEGSGMGNGGGGYSHGRRGAGGSAAAATGGLIFGGVYENARLNDTNIKAIATAQVPFKDWSKTLADLRDREFADAEQYAWATGSKVHPFAEIELEGARLLRTLSPEKQKAMMQTAMPFIALEAKEKEVSVTESTDAFIGLAHMAGIYDPKKAYPLFKSMVEASISTHASLSQIARAASYALPSLHAAGANSSDVLLLVATMMQGGILNTKSGTWLNALGTNIMPNTLGSGLFKNATQNDALQKLGLYKGNTSQFYKNGTMDLMSIVSILAKARTHLDPQTFNILLGQAFGKQGQRAAAFFSQQTTLNNLTALEGLNKQKMSPYDVGAHIAAYSTVGKADLTIGRANVTLMRASDTFTGPANSLLGATSSFFGSTADFSKDHPLVTGALGAGSIYGLFKSWKFLRAGGATRIFSMLERFAMSAGKNAIMIVARGMVSGIEGAVTAVGALAASTAAAAGSGFVAALYSSGLNKGEDAAVSQIQAGHVPYFNQKSIVIHNHTHLDGKEVARSVTTHQANAASRPQQGTGLFDLNMAPMPSG